MGDRAYSDNNASDSISTTTTFNKGYVKISLISLGFLWIFTSTNTLIIATGVLAYSTRTDGKWSNWGSWSECRFGQRTRTRYCNNPQPSVFGQYCQGLSEKYRICNLVSCKDDKLAVIGSERWFSKSRQIRLGDTDDRKSVIAFTAHGLNRKVSFDTILTFTKIEFNMGNAYNNDTGKFTCPTAGMYYFSITLTKFYKRIAYLSAYLRVNGKNKIRILSDPSNNNNNDMEAVPLTASGTYYLDKGDEVFIFGEPDNFYDGVLSQFTGFQVSSNYIDS